MAAVVPFKVPPKETAPLLALVLIVLVPDRTAVVVPVVVKEAAVMLLEIVTPAALELVMLMAPSGVVPPTIPEKVVAPEPEVRVSP